MAAKKEASGRAALKKVADYKAVFDSPVGRRVLHDMMSAHNMLNSSFSKDPYQMAFNEGGRNVLLRIMTIMKVDLKQLEERMREADASSDL